MGIGSWSGYLTSGPLSGPVNPWSSLNVGDLYPVIDTIGDIWVVVGTLD